MGPRAPKQAPEAPKTASKTDFGAILVDFWLIFWLFFGWFGGSSRLFLLVVVLVCCLVGLLVCWFLGVLSRCDSGCLVCLLCVCRLPTKYHTWCGTFEGVLISGLLVVCLSAAWP